MTGRIIKTIVSFGIVAALISSFTACGERTAEQKEAGVKEQIQELALSDNAVELPEKYELTNTALTYSGRWFEKELDGKSAMVTLNQGAMMEFETEKTSRISVEFVDISELETPYYAYSIDRGPMVRRKITEPDIALPDENAHQITIVIDGITEREDKWNREVGVAVRGVDAHGGVTHGLDSNKKTIMFIGDSITEGIMSLSDNAISDYNSATHSYGWYLAEALDARPYFNGFGGTGIVATGSFSDCMHMLTNFSSMRAAEWPMECSLVVLNTGTNDFGVETEEFVNGYRAVLDLIHEKYPDVKVLCMVPFMQSHRDDIALAVQGTEWCRLVETKDWILTYSDGIHPDAEGAERAAQYLLNEID